MKRWNSVRHALSALVIAAAFVPGLASAAAAEELDDLLIKGQDWELVADGFTFTEGPAVDLHGGLYFTDPFRNIVYRINADGKSEIFVQQSHGTNGTMFGPDARLYACQNSKKQIVAYDADGKDHVIADGVQSNDIVVNREGAIYFTDPPNKQVWYISPQGEKRVVDKGLGYANGLILSPDQKTLVVADMRGVNLWAYAIQPDGSLADKRPLYTLKTPETMKDSGADGMTIDSQGRIYCTSHLGLQVFDATGKLIGIIDKPHNNWLANAVFGGPELDTLYVTSMGKVFKRKLNAKGIRYFDAADGK
jgi:sugar lactone lactonase YvrE